MSSYVHRPTKVEAIKFDGENLDDVLEFINNRKGERYSAVGVRKPDQFNAQLHIPVTYRDDGYPAFIVMIDEYVVQDGPHIYSCPEEQFKAEYTLTEDFIAEEFRKYDVGKVTLPKDILKGHIILPIDRLCPHDWSEWEQIPSNVTVIEKWRSECANCKEFRYLENFL